jgi:hypothetical protein
VWPECCHTCLKAKGKQHGPQCNARREQDTGNITLEPWQSKKNKENRRGKAKQESPEERAARLELLEGAPQLTDVAATAAWARLGKEYTTNQRTKFADYEINNVAEYLSGALLEFGISPDLGLVPRAVAEFADGQGLHVELQVDRPGWLADSAYDGGSGTHQFRGWHGTVPDALRPVIEDNG